MVNALLVVRPSSLGDVVHALSIVPDIVRVHPGTAIDWVCEPAFADLPALSPHIRNVIPFALRRWRHALLQDDTWREVRAFRSAVRATRYDAILDLQEQIKGGVVARIARGVRHGFDRASIREPIATWFDDVHHRVSRDEHFATRCRLLAGAALRYTVDGPPKWDLVARGNAVVPPGRYAVAMHATSRTSKLWPESNWRAVIEGLSGAGIATILPWGAPAERERSERLAQGIEGAAVPERQSLRAMASLLADADVVVGVDTGMTHLAAALGTPTIALFTQTDPRGAGVGITGPHARDLGGRGVVPELDDVRAALGEIVRASPRC